MLRLALTIALVLSWQLTPSRCNAQPWQAGIARVKITPELPIWLSGYAARTKPAQEVHDDLWAKALALQDANGRRAVLVTIDLIGIDRDFSRDVCRRIEERFKLPRAAIVLATSHTHSGPVVGTNLAPMYALDQRQTESVRDYTNAACRTSCKRRGRSVAITRTGQVIVGHRHRHLRRESPE